MAKTAWDASHVRLHIADDGVRPVRARLAGNATFLRLPKILDHLESLPKDCPVELDLTEVHHLDHAFRMVLESWAARHSTAGTEPVQVTTAAF